MSVLSQLIWSGFKGELGAHVSPFTAYMVRIQGELGAHVSPFTAYIVRIQRRTELWSFFCSPTSKGNTSGNNVTGDCHGCIVLV